MQVSAHAQVTVSMKMTQLLDEQPFVHGVTTEADWGYYFNVTRLQYYISQVILVHDGGQRTMIPDLYFLVDPTLDSIFPLGTFSLTDLEGIEFGIGVDSATNHLDPALYPENHPLALKNPSMHWGWAGGYRFIAFDGYAGQSSGLLASKYEIHTIADENYHVIQLPVQEIVSGDSVIIAIEADYAELLHKIDVSLGATSHSSVGKSRQIALNMERVFSTDIISQTSPISNSISLSISPNPTADQFSILIPDQIDLPLLLKVTDMQGKVVKNEIARTYIPLINVEGLTAGVYVVTLMRNDQVIGVEKVVVE
jgi:hypothetical protein